MFIKLYFIALPVFFIIDIIWLSFVAKAFYAKQLGFLMKSNLNVWAIASFYMLFVAGLVIFVISPALANNSSTKALLLGALFGLVTYATYDLTNLATIKNWPLIVTLIDLIWGTVLSALVSIVSYFIADKLCL